MKMTLKIMMTMIVVAISTNLGAVENLSSRWEGLAEARFPGMPSEFQERAARSWEDIFGGISATDFEKVEGWIMHPENNLKGMDKILEEHQDKYVQLVMYLQGDAQKPHLVGWKPGAREIYRNNPVLREILDKSMEMAVRVHGIELPREALDWITTMSLRLVCNQLSVDEDKREAVLSQLTDPVGRKLAIRFPEYLPYLAGVEDFPENSP